MKTKLLTAFGILLVISTSASCRRRAPAEDEATDSKGNMIADTGFRPGKNGYKFENQGGQYPKTPGVLNAAGVARMMGKEACVGGDLKSCKLTPAATEWMGMVNKAMNIGQCEGMAVSTLAFFKKAENPSAFGAASVHDLTHPQVKALIGYYWAFQMVNPVRFQTIKSLYTQTPVGAEDTLAEMMKRGEFATLAVRSSHGGHAVTPYAIEDRGNGIHWIRIYDNNWPDKERYVIIDRNANTWKYELASLNPDVPKMPWEGTAESHTIAVTPLAYRLGKAECPFCTGGNKKFIRGGGANGVSITNAEGKKLGRGEDGKIVNEIPDAEVVELASYLEGAPPGEPMYAVPHDGDYDIHIHGNDHKVTDAHNDGDHGVTIVGNGSAVSVETSKLKPGEKDTLSVHHEGEVKYHSAQGGTIPPIRLAHDGDGTHGMTARITNMKAGAHEPVALKMDHKEGAVHVSGGGKTSESFDLKVTHHHAGAENTEVEHKGIKYKAGETHSIHTDPKPGAKHGPLKVTRAPTPKAKPVEHAKEHGREPAKHTPAATPKATPRKH